MKTVGWKSAVLFLAVAIFLAVLVAGPPLTAAAEADAGTLNCILDQWVIARGRLAVAKK